MSSEVTSQSSKIDFVTVVFAGELELLRLQARSIARFVEQGMVGKIILIINDRRESDLVAPLEALSREYGVLQTHVEIVSPDKIFRWDVGPSGLLARLKAAYTRRRAFIPGERQSGWRRHRGWQLQQAMKLASVRKCVSEFVVILDAKNHFLAPIGLLDFVSETGNSLTYYEQIGDWQKRWFRDACKVIGIDPALADETRYMPSMTPFVVRRGFLGEVLDRVEERAGPVQVLFGTKRDEVTEFALIFAHCLACHGAIEPEFELGLEPAAFTVRGGAAAFTDDVIAQVESGASKVFGLHSGSLNDLNEAQRERISALWVDRKLALDHSSAQDMLGAMERAA